MSGLARARLSLALTGSRGIGDSFHHSLDFANLLIAQVGFLFQGAQHDFIQTHVNLNFPGRWFDAFSGQFAGEHLVKDDAQVGELDEGDEGLHDRDHP